MLYCTGQSRTALQAAETRLCEEQASAALQQQDLTVQHTTALQDLQEQHKQQLQQLQQQQQDQLHTLSQQHEGDTAAGTLFP